MRHLFILTIIVSNFLGACSTKDRQGTELTYDSSRIAILSQDRTFVNIFDSRQYQPSTITQKELNKIDSITLVCVTEYNNSLDSGHEDFKIKLGTKTITQIVIAQNQNGQKEVWINCMCDGEKDLEEIYSLKFLTGDHVILNFRINLTTEKYFDLIVNGFA